MRVSNVYRKDAKAQRVREEVYSVSKNRKRNTPSEALRQTMRRKETVKGQANYYATSLP